MGKQGQSRRGAGPCRAEGLPAASNTTASEKVGAVILFYGHNKGKPYCEFSNFFQHDRPYEFMLPEFAWRQGLPTSIWCQFSEKAIMATKAALMGDLDAFREIDCSDNPGRCKALGRGVRNFNEMLWQRHLEEVAYEVVRQKFASTGALRKVLLSTGSAVLAEAAPSDSVWGIGMPLRDERARIPSQWCGRNVLGFALMRARAHLCGCTLSVADARRFAFPVTESAVTEAVPIEVAADDATSTEGLACATPSAVERRACAVANSMVASRQSAAVLGATEAPRKKRWGNANVAVKEFQATCASNETAARSSSSSALSVDQCGQASSAGRVRHCFAILDFEATCDDKERWEPQEVIEFPIVLVDSITGEAVCEFRTFVRPVQLPVLTDFCKTLTGIQQQDVDTAPGWSNALHAVETWLDVALTEHGYSSCVFVTCGDWDLKTMMPKQCSLADCHVPERFRSWLNIKDVFEKVEGKPGKSMVQMLKGLNLALQGRHHSGIDDCRNIARIMQRLLVKRHAVWDELHGLIKSGPQGRGGKGKQKGYRTKV